MYRKQTKDYDKRFCNGTVFLKLRYKKGVSILEVEKETSIARENIRLIEQCKIKSPSFIVVAKLAEYYGIKMEELKSIASFL